MLFRSRRELRHRLLANVPEDNSLLQPYCPFVYTEVPSIHNRGFEWGDYYRRGLIKLNEPLPYAKRRCTVSEIEHVMRLHKDGTRQRGTAELRLQLETAMQERKVLWWVMDNAAALTHVAAAKTYIGQLNTIMSLANMSRSAIIVSGTYELLSLFYLNAQLDRRIIDIEMPNYDHLRSEQSYLDFCSAAQQLVLNSPIPFRGDPVSYLPWLYEGSCGCVGTLRGWLDKTLSYAITKELGVITKETLKKWAHNKGKLTTMRQEIVDGQALYASFLDKKEKQSESDINVTKERPRGRRSPGKRSAHHDPVEG